jgi:hypothetical protein
MSVDWSEVDRLYEAAEVEDSNFDLIPDGVYTAQILNISLEYSKKDNTPQLKWELKILGPSYANKHLWKYASLIPTPEALKWLKSELQKIGFIGDKISAFVSTANYYIEKTVEVNLKTTERNGVKRQAIYFRKLIDEGPAPVQSSRFQQPVDDGIPF